MNIVEMYQEAEWIRCFISNFNYRYIKQNVAIDTRLLQVHMQNLCKMGMLDKTYWKSMEVEFQEVYKQIENIERALEAEDFVYIKDKLNHEFWRFIKKICEVLFEKGPELLSDYFWKENKKVLDQQYPDISKKMEILQGEEPYICTRDYGIRGKVVYKETAEREYDLYSAYNPFEMELHIAGIVDLGKYSKVYIWGCNGGFEMDVVIQLTQAEGVNIELFLTDLYEFRQVLSNTLRTGSLLCSNVNWNCDIGVEDFFKIFNFEKEKKEDIFIYISRFCYGKELDMLREFICRNSLNSNLT